MMDLAPESFDGRITFVETGHIRLAYLYDRNLGSEKEISGVPQGPNVSEHELRTFVSKVAPKGTRVRRNGSYGNVYDLFKQ
jgi:hypothetical protein